MRNIMSFTEFEKLVENSSTTILDTHSNVKFSDIIEFLDFCSFKPFDYEEVKTLEKNTLKMALSFTMDDIVFDDLLDYPDDDREEVIIFAINELEDLFRENKSYFKNGEFFVHINFKSHKIYGGYYFKNPIYLNKIEKENKTFENKLKRKINDINEQIHIIYNPPELQKIKPKSYTKEINTILRKYNLENNCTLLDFKLSCIKDFILSQKGNINISQDVINKLITRWSTNMITYSDIKKIPMSIESQDFIKRLETKKQEFNKWIKIRCIDTLGSILIDACKEFARCLKYLYDNFNNKIINSIDKVLKDKTQNSYKVLNNLKDLLNEIDNIGGYKKLFFENNRFIMLGQLYKKINFINNNILVINKLK